MEVHFKASATIVVKTAIEQVTVLRKAKKGFQKGGGQKFNGKSHNCGKVRHMTTDFWLLDKNNDKRTEGYK